MFTITPRSPSASGSVPAMADAAIVITWNVPMTFSSWMNLNALGSWGELSRLMTRPTQPVPAQLTATRRFPPSAAWFTARWQSSGSVTSPADVVGADLVGQLLGPLLVAVEDGAADAERLSASAPSRPRDPTLHR